MESDDDKIHRNDIEELLSLEKLINIFLHEQICEKSSSNSKSWWCLMLMVVAVVWMVFKMMSKKVKE